MIKLIIFDIGGVLISFTEQQYIRYLSKKLKIAMQDIAEVLLPLITAMEYGKMKEREAKWMFADQLNVPGKKLEWVPAFKKIARINKNTFRLAERLSKRYTVAILSDISKSRYDEVEKKGLNRLKAKRFLSFKMKLRKQDPNPRKQPFRRVLKEMGVKPGEALFIDDRRTNISHAQHLGINCIQYRNYGQLVRDLKKFGIA